MEKSSAGLMIGEAHSEWSPSIIKCLFQVPPQHMNGNTTCSCYSSVHFKHSRAAVKCITLSSSSITS